MSEFKHISKVLGRVLDEIMRTQELVKQREKPFMSIDEASEYLNLSKATIYSYTSRGIISFHKLQDRKLYFAIEDLNKFILNSENRYKSDSEIESEAMSEVLNGKL